MVQLVELLAPKIDSSAILLMAESLFGKILAKVQRQSAQPGQESL